jgi:ABC-type lipoprotein export system ATPase subunit/ABC-type lipoprotein release transport system permease subunit
MIEIKKLSKIYKLNKEESCTALKDISFTLPDTGMVFIVGKSGSGKSTLLNLIGGLDSVTSGNIIADGNDLTVLTSKEFDDYRSSYLTFIFQDYKLFDGLTIKQNVEVGLDITNSLDDKMVELALKKVGLEGYQSRYPYELSGGQQQRVAIARALTRNSHLILADEPTGNLDERTSKQILDILKTISKKKLVVIVSHNLNDADLYADRIIELHDGVILSDKVRNNDYSNKFNINDNIGYLPHYNDLTLSEANSLMMGLNDGSITNIKQIDNGFIDVDNDVLSNNRNIKLKKKSANNKSLLKILKLFFTKKLHNRIMVVIFSVILFSILTVLQGFVNFTPTVNSIDDNRDYVILNKGEYVPYESKLYTSPLYKVTKIEEYYYKKSGYKGDMYKINNYTIPIVKSNDYISNKHTIPMDTNFDSFFIKHSYGTVVCNEEYLAKRYHDENGNLNVLAGKVNYKQYGVIITDYMAHAMFFHGEYDEYEDLIGLQNVNGTPFYINAVIDTGYTDRYKELFDILTESDNKEDLINQVKNNPMYQEYIDEVMSFLGVTYSFNPTFKKSLLLSGIYKSDSFSKVKFGYNDYSYSVHEDSITISSDEVSNKYDLNDGEIVITTSLYNSIFNTMYTLDNYNLSINNKIVVEFYNKSRGKQVSTYKKEFTIVDLSDSNIVDKDDFNSFMEEQIIDYGLYFENNKTSSNVLRVAAKYGYYVKSIDFESGLIFNKMIVSFESVFTVIIIAIYLVLFGYIISYGFTYIKNNIEDIGVYNAFGGKIKNIIKVVFVDIIITGAMIIGLSSIAIPIIVNIADSLMLTAIEKLLGLSFINMSIIRIYPNILFYNYLILIVCIIASTIIPTLVLFRYKPIEIIRSGK